MIKKLLSKWRTRRMRKMVKSLNKQFPNLNVKVLNLSKGGTHETK